MIGTQTGTVLALPGMARGVYYSGEPAGATGRVRDPPVMMAYYDLTTVANPQTTYVTVAGCSTRGGPSRCFVRRP